MNSKEIKEVWALEPGKIYCLQVDLDRVDWEFLESVVEGFNALDIKVVLISKNMDFVRKGTK